MTPLEERLTESADYIRKHITVEPRVGLILGSGLGEFADNLVDSSVLSSDDIPHYPASTVEGHGGRLVFAKLGTTQLLVFQGRVHFYESGSAHTILYPIHLAHLLGVKTLVVTNAAGGVNRTFNPGDLMVIVDQIDLTFEMLRRSQASTYVSRGLYTPRLIQLTLDIGKSLGIRLKTGVYAGVKGPSYETASEVDMIYRLGGDAVGMSTVLEVSLAASLGMEVLGISCITNLATGISKTRLSHTEVTDAGNRVRGRFGNLLESALKKL